MNTEPRRIVEHPVVKALRPVRPPYLDRLTDHADLHVWHIDVSFEEFSITPDLRARWSDEKVNTVETWRKRPLTLSDDESLPYSCGEVELVTRLRRAAIEAVWISEWSGFPHVDIWCAHCVKRSEFGQREPALREFDKQLRVTSPYREALEASGGHPDIGVLTDRGYVFVEYKGPGDSIRPKQRMWAETLIARESPRLVYIVARGLFSPSEREVTDAVHPTSPTPVQEKAGATPSAPPSRMVRGTKKPAGKEKLHRRTISDTLKRERDWDIVSRVGGWIDFSVPSSAPSADHFADEVREAVRALGYEPTVRLTRESGGREVVRVHTPETLAQEGRGGHGC